MPISWISGTTSVYAVSTSLNATTPAGIENDDGLFAFVMTRSVLTPPSGWTVVASGSAFGSSNTQYLYAVKKNTVTSADSSVAVTWTQASNARIGVTYALVRGDGKKITVSEFAINNTSYYYGTTYNIPSLTATSPNGELFLGGITSVIVLGSFTSTPPSGMTLWSAGTTDNRLHGAYQARAAGQNNNTSWTYTNDGNENGVTSIVLRVRDAGIPVGWADSTTFYDTLGYPESVVDAVTLTPAHQASLKTGAGLTESLSHADTSWVTRRPYASVTEAVDVALTQAVDLLASGVLSDTVQVQNLYSLKQTLAPVLVERAQLRESLRFGKSAYIVNAATIASAASVMRHVQLLDQLQVSGPLTLYSRQYRTVAESVALRDELARMLGGTLQDAATVLAVLAHRHRATPALSDTATISDTSAHQLWVRLDATENVVLPESWTPAQVLRVLASDTVAFSGAFLSPTQLLTWAVNARTGATTTYTNFPYTSFAKRGSHYLATAEDGLYQLDGNTDNGAAIIAEMESGFMQFAGTRFASFKAIYLGMHGSGTVFFRLTTGDDKTYTYRVVAQNMENTKVRVGKGLRARYFSFALETAGQDFDLDTVEFVAIGAQRRV